MKKILVPTDFSDYARDALVYAIEISKVMGGGEVILMNAYPDTSISPYVYDQLIDSIRREIKTRTINRLKEEWHKNKKKPGGKGNLKVEFVAEEGTIVDNIIKIAKDKKVDMIVMGTKGAGPIKRFLFGSTASKIIGKSPCPVFAVPKLAKYKRIERILFATECNNHEIKSIADVAELATAYNATIHIAFITDKQKKTAENELEKFKALVNKKARYGKMHFELIQSGDAVDAIDVYIQLKKISLLSLATKRKSLFNKIFNKNLAQEMSFHLKIPLLAYHR